MCSKRWLSNSAAVNLASDTVQLNASGLSYATQLQHWPGPDGDWAESILFMSS